jgi:putative ABC transport system permease protein
MIVLKMAARNIWRNKRRTFITAASVMFAGLLAISLTSIETGMWDDMLQSIVNQSTGQLQLQSEKYFDEPTLDNSFEVPLPLMQKIQEINGVSGINPRIENFILAANADKTRPVFSIGINPESEDRMTGLKGKVIKGQYLNAQPQSGVMVGKLLAERLQLNIGDTIVFFGQGYQGIVAVGAYPVTAILELTMREMNSQMVYLNLQDAWELYQAHGRYTNLMVRVDNNRQIAAVAKELKQFLPESDQSGLKVYTWDQLMPELIEAKKMDEASTLIMMLILYLVVSFGIFGTLLMLMNERRHEMGILIAIGMKKAQVMLMVWLEFLLIALLGLGIAMFLALIVVSYLKSFPIPLGENMQEVFEQYGMKAQLTATVDPGIFIRELIIVATIVSVLSVYPLWIVYRLDPKKAMQS